jgi:hypothetical protein
MLRLHFRRHGHDLCHDSVFFVVLWWDLDQKYALLAVG